MYGVHLIKDFLKNATEREADIDVMLLGFDDGLHHYSIDVAEGEEPFRIITCFGEH